MVFEESIEVEGRITCIGEKRYSLVVDGDIDAGDINARDIDARDINAVNIDARDIDAVNIDARDIDAWDIDAGNINAESVICETRRKRTEPAKTIARIFIQNKSKLVKKEWQE